MHSAFRSLGIAPLKNLSAPQKGGPKQKTPDSAVDRGEKLALKLRDSKKKEILKEARAKLLINTVPLEPVIEAAVQKESAQ